MIQCTFRLDDDVVEGLRLYAKNQKRSLTYVVAEILANWVDDHQESQSPLEVLVKSYHPKSEDV